MKQPKTLAPQRTWRCGKYVVAADFLVPKFSGEKPLERWCTVEEMLQTHPNQIEQIIVAPPRKLPEYRYFYSGNDPNYNAGVMPEWPQHADYLLRIQRGRALGRYCIIHGPNRIGLTEFDYTRESLEHIQELSAGRLNPRYWKHALKSVLSAKRLPPVQYCPGKVAALNLPGSNNYFHWMAEVLPRLLCLRKSNIIPDWYLIDAYTPFHLQTLKAFNVPLDRVIQPHSSIFVEADELLVPSRGFPNGCRGVGVELVKRLGGKADIRSTGRVFVNRRGSRQPSNKVEFQRLLRQFDIEQHYMEDYGLPEQIALFNRSEIIVGLHGSGLANLLFCRPGTHAVELMPEGKWQPCYPMLSRIGGLRHYMLTAKRTGFHQDMVVPLDPLRAILTKITSRKQHKNVA